MLRPGLVIAAIVVALDQLTKLWAEAALVPYRPVGVLPSVQLTLSYNPGAAFSFLAGQGGWQRWFFTVLALGVSVWLAFWLRSLPRGDWWHTWSLSLVLGGAIGNVIDRIAYGHVVDFVDLYYGDWHWPAFNLADSAITVGVVLLVVLTLRPGLATADRR